MPPSLKPPPPDDPIFTIGPSLVFRSDVDDEGERDDDPVREELED
jgi:hypothetical protein